jgi:hypothetical protein
MRKYLKKLGRGIESNNSAMAPWLSTQRYLRTAHFETCNCLLLLFLILNLHVCFWFFF